MTKEKIIETIEWHSVSRHFGEYREITHEDCKDIADELLELIEQEKKEVAKDILSKMQYALENPKASKDFAIYTLGLTAKEYGVEL